MDFDKAYAVDKDAAENGKWLVTRAGLNVKVAKVGNPAFVAEVARLQKPHLALLRSSADNTELIDKITVKAMSKTVLLDWEAEANGERIPYTSDLGFQYMTKNADFREDISELSVERNNFKPEDIAEK